jgi:hypothetical protein
VLDQLQARTSRKRSARLSDGSLQHVYDRGGRKDMTAASDAMRKVYDPQWHDKLTRFLPQRVNRSPTTTSSRTRPPATRGLQRSKEAELTASGDTLPELPGLPFLCEPGLVRRGRAARVR